MYAVAQRMHAPLAIAHTRRSSHADKSLFAAQVNNLQKRLTEVCACSQRVLLGQCTGCASSISWRHPIMHHVACGKCLLSIIGHTRKD